MTGITGFQLRNVPLLSRVGADRADALRTDVDAALAGWPDAQLLRVDRRNQVLISGGQVVLGRAARLGDKPPENAVFLGRLTDGRHVWAIRAALEGPEDTHAETEVLDLRRAGQIFDDVSAQLVATATASTVTRSFPASTPR
jgi:NAD+ diphosphatase